MFYSSSFYGQKKDHKETVDHLRLAQKVGKHTKKKENRLKKATRELSKLKKSKSKSESFNFSALHLLYDPQGMIMPWNSN